MNIMQSNPRQLLGEDLAVGAGNCSLTYRTKASYDKTYAVTILGVGQDFTDDVAQAEQESIVKKYNIPAVSNDDTIYYTFKLEGIYYSVRQNGNFKLYEQTILRVPNNNWDRMFLERLGEAESDGKDAQRNFYVAVNEPPIAGKVYGRNFGQFTYSMWVKVKLVRDSDKIEIVFDKLYKLVYDDYDTTLSYDYYTYYKEVGCLYESGTVVGNIDIPAIDAKLVEQYNGEYYWLRKSSDGLSISNIYRCIKRYNDETGLYKYQWDLDHPMFDKYEYDIDSEGAPATSNAIELSKDYNFYPCRGIASTYRETKQEKAGSMDLYLSLLPPMVEGDMWFQIDDNMTRVVNALYQCYDVSKEQNSATKYEWQKVGNFFDGQIIVSEIEAGSYQEGDLWIQHYINDESNWEGWVWRSGYINKWITASISPYPNDHVVKGSYYVKTDSNYKISEVYIGTTISEEWDPKCVEMVYPEDKDGNSITIIDSTAPPDADGLIWAKVDNTTGLRVQSISRCLHKNWELKYKVGAREPLIIPYPTEPKIGTQETELSKGDCYVYYKEGYKTVNGESRLIKTFSGLYKYIPNWEKIEGNIECGDKLPEEATEGDYFIVADEDFANVAAYLCTASSFGETPCKWGDATEGETFTYPYPPFQEGDYWVKINSVEGKQAQALYIFFEGNWLLFLNNDAGGVGEFMDPPGSGVSGDWVFNTSERFNDYRAHEFDVNTQKWTGGNWSFMKYDHVEGYGNKSVYENSEQPPSYRSTPMGYNHIEGSYNYLIGASFRSHIEGSYNKITHNSRSYADTDHIEGSYNTYNPKDSFTTANHIEGYGNNLTGSCATHVGGLDNTVNNCNSTHVHGRSNTVKKCNYSAVFGENNNVGANDAESYTESGCSYVGVFGSGNRVKRDYCVAIGYNIDTTRGGGQDYYLAVNGAAGADYPNFTVDGAGTVRAWRVYAERMFSDQYLPRGADYAEYFEWLDGNPESEDRCGMLVTLDGDKIVLANDDNVFGIVSASPAVVGNSYEEYWHGKYVKDVYGRRIVDENGEYIISPDYDDAQEYIPRSQRPEWAPIGIVGKFIINDDGSCVSGKFVVAINGIGTLSNKNTGILMLRRIDESHIEVFMK